KEPAFNLPTQRQYDAAFTPNYVVTQFDNVYLNPQYQVFTGGGFVQPTLSAIAKVGTADLFEDYKIEGGFRLPFNLNGNEYFMSIEHRKNRIDKQFIFDRQNNLYLDGGNRFIARITSHEVRY